MRTHRIAATVAAAAVAVSSCTRGEVTDPSATNQQPSISLVAPVTGATTPVNATLTVTATADDQDGTVVVVEFFDNDALIGSDHTSPYAVNWTPSVSGTHTLTARATDDSGATAVSSPVGVTVTASPPPPPPNQRPSVALTSPADGTTIVLGGAVTVSATASDPDGTIASVQFLDGATVIGTDATSPYSITWTPAGTGTHTITARATDDDGEASVSGARTVSVSSPPTGGSATFVGAGDIARCSATNDEATAALLDGIQGTVFTLGDNVYENGTATEFANCYHPSWGRHKARTRPVAGNHDYNTSGASGYYDYFGDAAGPRGKGYYSFDLGGWHIVVLNSNISRSASSEQIAWLRADLAANPAQCTMALWHHPRFSSGSHGNDTSQQTFWDVLYEFHADVVLVGHEHDYERFARQTPAAVADPAHGIRQFIVGTGGTSLRSFSTIRANSEFRNNTAWGVIKLDLTATGYTWSFISTSGAAVLDTGSETCH